MHPNYPSQSYSWPWRDDDCWEPHTHVATTTPSLSSASGHQYHISPNDIEVIENLIQFQSQLHFCAQCYLTKKYIWPINTSKTFIRCKRPVTAIQSSSLILYISQKKTLNVSGLPSNVLQLHRITPQQVAFQYDNRYGK